MRCGCVGLAHAAQHARSCGRPCSDGCTRWHDERPARPAGVGFGEMAGLRCQRRCLIRPAITKVHQGGGLAASTTDVLTMHATIGPPVVGTIDCRDETVPSGFEGNGGRMGSSVLGFDEIDQAQVSVVGGKGAHLGELSRIEGIRVPAGFCVSTDAFGRIMADAPSIDERLHRLSHLSPDDRQAIRTLSAEIRRTIEGITVPEDLGGGVTRSVVRLGEYAACAVRPADGRGPADGLLRRPAGHLPERRGSAAILEHIRRCWASLVHGAGRDVPPPEQLHTGGFPWAWSCSRWSSRMRPALCSRPIPPRPTARSSWSRPAWPRRSPRLGPGEPGRLRECTTANSLPSRSPPSSWPSMPRLQAGLTRVAIDPGAPGPAGADRCPRSCDSRSWGGRIEAHFGHPQDVEWCLDDERFPDSAEPADHDAVPRTPTSVTRRTTSFISVGHNQMMTDAMKPLGGSPSGN